jgi:hypothetical protein
VSDDNYREIVKERKRREIRDNCLLVTAELKVDNEKVAEVLRGSLGGDLSPDAELLCGEDKEEFLEFWDDISDRAGPGGESELPITELLAAASPRAGLGAVEVPRARSSLSIGEGGEIAIKVTGAVEAEAVSDLGPSLQIAEAGADLDALKTAGRGEDVFGAIDRKLEQSPEVESLLRRVVEDIPEGASEEEIMRRVMEDPELMDEFLEAGADLLSGVRDRLREGDRSGGSL